MLTWSERTEALLAQRITNARETLEFIKNLSRKERRRFWKLVKSKPFFMASAEELVYSSHRAVRKVDGILTARIVTCSMKWKEKNFMSHAFITNIGKFQNDPALVEKFERLPSYSQYTLWSSSYLKFSNAPCADRGYMDLLYMTKLPPEHVKGAKEKVLAYRNQGRTSRDADSNSESGISLAGLALKEDIDLTPPSEEFLDVLSRALKPKEPASNRKPSYRRRTEDSNMGYDGSWLVFGRNGAEIGFLLKAAYTEPVIIDFLEKVLDEKEQVCLDQAIMLLNDWGSYRDAPLSWGKLVNDFIACSSHSVWIEDSRYPL